MKILKALKKSIALHSIDFEYFCDLSSYSLGENFDTHKIASVWSMKENALHFNCKDLLAVYNSLRRFRTYFRNKHVKIFSDSSVGVQIINKIRTTKSSICNILTKIFGFFM